MLNFLLSVLQVILEDEDWNQDISYCEVQWKENCYTLIDQLVRGLFWQLLSLKFSHYVIEESTASPEVFHFRS